MLEIPLSRCLLNEETKEAALRALESGRYILGRECEEFEAELAAYIGTRHAVLGSSCTAVTTLLYLALGLKTGDEVIIPSHTAFPCVEPIIHCGAKPVFVDIDDTFCIDVDRIDAAITSRTVGILPVHLYGHPADMDPALAIARKHGLWVVEDCAQAMGSRYRGKVVGSLGLAGVASFFPSKNLTVLGDGGCVFTNDDAVVERIRMLRNHGRREKYTHELVGYNLRFNEIQAAIGRVALRYLDERNRHRRSIARYYDQRLAAVAGVPTVKSWAEHVYYMYVIRTARRDSLATFLRDAGIGTGIHYPVPVHHQPALREYDANLSILPATESAANEILSIPMFGDISLNEAACVCDRILEFAREGC